MSGATATVAAPTSRRRRILAWVAIGVVMIGVGIAGVMLSSGGWSQRGVLDPDSAGPQGALALTEILREQGVDVTVARDRAAAESALDAADATLVIADAPYLSDAAMTSLTDAATDVVLIDPRARTLRLLFEGTRTQGVGDGQSVAAGCDLPAAQRANEIVPGAYYSPGSDLQTCFPLQDGWALVAASHGDGGLAVAVDGRALFTNEHLAENGNAALGVNLLGSHPRVVWYLGSAADSDLAASDPTLGELTPPWVSPVIVVLLAAGLAAAVWQGRRFGPLVTERLPVTVRTSETTEGRARLYANAHDTVHAADQLRIGALGRLSMLLGLGPAASAAEIADAAASRLATSSAGAAAASTDRAAVHALLIHDLPRTDAELIALAANLRALEAAVHAAVRPERNHR